MAIPHFTSYSFATFYYLSSLFQVGMLTFITSMCISLPISLLIPAILHKTRVITTTRKEKLSLYCGEFCARWSLRLFPFASLTVINKNVVATNNDNGSLDMGFDSNNNSNNFDAGNTGDDSNNKNTYKNNKRPIGNKIKSRNDNNNQQTSEPTVWVCNHQSMLDVFFLLASSNRLLSRMTAQGRGRRRRRPIKIIYWKQLEANPITRILFKMCGFISVDMDDNGNGNDNVYHVSSFRSMMKSAKKALLVDGFDLGILPEGQLNPTPEKGLLPIFSGAYTLSKMARCPIRMMGIHGSYKLWHPKEDIGMSVTERNVKVRMYPEGCQFCCAKEFEDTFEKVVGYFGAQGRDLPSDELRQWVDGTMWKNSMKLSAQIS